MIECPLSVGLNHDTTTHENGMKLAPEEIEIRRRIVWAAFSESSGIELLSYADGQPTTRSSRSTKDVRYLSTSPVCVYLIASSTGTKSKNSGPHMLSLGYKDTQELQPELSAPLRHTVPFRL
jgi:hypothetical protein